MFLFRNSKKHDQEFSKALLMQESALIWIITLSFIALAFYCVIKEYLGSLPWLTSLIGFPWAAYGVSQACYYGKAAKENTVGGMAFENMMASLNFENNNNYEDNTEFYDDELNF